MKGCENAQQVREVPGGNQTLEEGRAVEPDLNIPLKEKHNEEKTTARKRSPSKINLGKEKTLTFAPLTPLKDKGERRTHATRNHRKG